MPWTLIIAERANRDLHRLTTRDREAVLRALERLAVSPGASNLKMLSGGRGEWRLRVGRWRVLLDLDNARGIITASHVLARKDAYSADTSGEGAPSLPRPISLQLRRVDLHAQARAVRHQQAAVRVAQRLADHVVQVEVAGDAGSPAPPAG